MLRNFQVLVIQIEDHEHRGTYDYDCEAMMTGETMTVAAYKEEDLRIRGASSYYILLTRKLILEIQLQIFQTYIQYTITMASSQSATANPCTECQKVHIIEAAKPKFEDYPYLLHEDKALNEPMENAEEAKSKFDPFTIHKGIYKGTTTFAVFVPKTLLSEDGAKKKCRIHVRFHGGGFVRYTTPPISLESYSHPLQCTGSATFAPWFAQYLLSLSIRENAIIISPNHPKLPESNGSELLSYIDAFWAWFGTANNLSNFLKIHNIPVTVLSPSHPSLPAIPTNLP
ncbi:hypothetical protein EJ04DRAFT_159255 [Polyplosphaeria fusca]|uniref:Uncharacterized protein n=1 Tax=Polyplosphaeria fusca TaxID=682080 RepID=A0A9P4V5H9_9PLEO|nr:hypothetical protein EJ04DRAFT_159255 [Polyplosphaeria fusca]